ncbi:MAG TPA: methyltransferase domain-containing protein [Candidatus Sericytochromatia bacterium]
MFEHIIQQAQVTDYDFRQAANPDDPLVHLFSEWVYYYKLKWAIAHVLKPASILEIGVRFGYSAAAFLHGNSAAQYVGIDLDTDVYGGQKGAINWAKEITQQFATKFVIADTQRMERLPGDVYDLIHVDGQQDRDDSFRDLELAIKQGRYVLLDGYLWTRQNFMAVSEFLFKYADLLNFYGVIPGYAGELLIKVSPNYLEEVNNKHYSKANSSVDIRQTYTTDYYTHDCGGFDFYKKNKGKNLEDPRLQAVAALASLKNSGRVIDIGCGRGELTYFFANQGYTVTAIDYSQSAIELAKTCFQSDERLKQKVQFYCDNCCTIELPGKYDLAVASDVIEHLAFEEVEALYQKVAQHINSDGLFVVHTFPNLWYYRYEYLRRRRIAASVGAYLPPQPRSRYELLMHINEQSPRVLKKQLNRHFKYVILWFADLQNPGGSLVNKFSKKEICAAPSLFALASHQPINQEQLKNRLQMYPLPSIPIGEINLLVADYPSEVVINSKFHVQIEIRNYSKFILNSYSPNPIHIAYHWMDKSAENYIFFEGERTKIFPPLAKLEGIVFKPLLGKTGKGTYVARIRALPEKGNYVLRVTLVQEGVRWFDELPIQLMKDIPIKVV